MLEIWRFHHNLVLNNAVRAHVGEKLSFIYYFLLKIELKVQYGSLESYISGW